MDDAPASRAREDVEAWLAEREEAFAARVRDTLTAIVTRALDAVAGTLVASVTADLSPIDGIPDAWFAKGVELADDLTSTYLGGSMSAWLGVSADMVDEQSASMWADVVNQNAESFMAGATNRLKGIGDNVWTSVRARLQQSLAQGYTIDALREEVARTAQVAIGRAETIARTETMGAYINGDMGGMQALGAKGPVEKVWRATSDARTRPSHVEASGQCVPFAADFTVGGVSMSHPHAAGAPADEVVNCRCYVEFLFPGDARPDGRRVAAPAQPPVTRAVAPKVAPKATAARRTSAAPGARPLKKLDDGMDPTKEFQIVARTNSDRLAMRLSENQVMAVERLDFWDAPSIHGAVAYRRGNTVVITELADAQEWAFLRANAKKLTFDDAMRRLGRTEVQDMLSTVDARQTDLTQLMKQLTIRSIPNPADAAVGQRLGLRGYSSVASAHGRTVTFWKGADIAKEGAEVLQHELGHLADAVVNGNVTGQSGLGQSAEWAAAQASDAARARSLLGTGWRATEGNARLGLTPFNPKGLTNYGQSAGYEDVAESFAMFVNQSAGPLVTVKDAAGVTRSFTFADVFPARAQLLDDLLYEALSLVE